MAEETSSLVPTHVLEGVARLDAKLQTLEANLTHLLLLSSLSHSLAHLSPIDRASAFLSLSKSVNTLFSVFLRTTGESPNDHPAKTEVERVELYEDKVERAIYRSKTPSRPTSSLNIAAANRFIEHSIPDLTTDQRKRVREVSQEKSRRLRLEDKSDGRSRKSPKRDKKDGESVAQAAAAFLAEAQRELLVEKRKNMDREGSQSDEEISD
ncbi:hypothetical protein O6H91_Y251100 [Diphasiastrum complanatum]|nr:hypothetical protein O6H91_Y251100 [Diphasiastrum complanatum]